MLISSNLVPPVSTARVNRIDRARFPFHPPPHRFFAFVPSVFLLDSPPDLHRFVQLRIIDQSSLSSLQNISTSIILDAMVTKLNESLVGNKKTNKKIGFVLFHCEQILRNTCPSMINAYNASRDIKSRKIVRGGEW